PQDLSGFGYARGQYREVEILVPVPPAGKRDERLAERDWPAVRFLTSRRKAMRWNVLLVATTLLAAASQPSVAQISVDMNQITCGGWLGDSTEQGDFVLFWMSGYYNAAADSNVLNYDRFQRNSAKIAAYCKKNKSKTLP